MKLFTGLAMLLLAGYSHAQCSLAGKVTDVNGQPIVGAHVMVMQSNKGALTDNEGRYTIEAVPLGGSEQLERRVK